MTIEQSLSASALDVEGIPSDIREFNKLLVEMIGQAGWSFPPPSVETLRSMSLGTVQHSDRASTRFVPFANGDIPIRVVASPEPTGVYVHCHGGGWTIGKAENQDLPLAAIVDRTGMTAVSIDYRLAPEHPYPAGLDDCELVARWVIENGQREFGANRIVIAGESAGANLALCTAIRLKGDEAGRSVAGVSLLYGNYDLTMTPSQRRADNSWMISRASLAWFYDQYVPDASRRDEPDVSPLYADLVDLPPILVAIGTADSLVDDSMFLACRLWAAQVPCQLIVVPGGEHAFDMAPVPSAQAAVADVHNFLAGLVGR